MDTAYNYQHFTAHTALAAAGGELLEGFEISTKVGFFPDGHSLDPVRLRAAVGQAVSELGRAPNTVLLHNPECSPGEVERACEAMAEMRDTGLFHAWGLSSWDPRPLLELDCAPPDVLMVRAGLCVPAGVLDAAEQLADRLRPKQLRGMAPFGGDATDPIWAQVDTGQFLEFGQSAGRLEAAFAAAFAIPSVTAVAVGTKDPRHLAQLRNASALRVDYRTVHRYRELLTSRHRLAAGASTRARESAAA